LRLMPFTSSRSFSVRRRSPTTGDTAVDSLFRRTDCATPPTALVLLFFSVASPTGEVGDVRAVGVATGTTGAARSWRHVSLRRRSNVM